MEELLNPSSGCFDDAAFLKSTFGTSDQVVGKRIGRLRMILAVHETRDLFNSLLNSIGFGNPVQEARRIVEYGDTKALASAIEYILKNKVSIDSFPNLSKLSWENVFRDYYSIYY